MGNWTGRLVSVLAVLLLLLYAGYQGYRYFYTPYRTETAYEYTVSDTLQAKGLIVRDEVLVEGSAAGSPSYCVEEGEKVKVGTEIIHYYSSDQQARDAAHADLLEQEIELLESVQTPGSYLFASSEALSGQIDELIGQLVDHTADNSAAGLSEIRAQLLELICKRQLSVEEVEGFDQRISQLKAEQAGYEAGLSTGNIASLTAPVQGYFSRYSDGCEGSFSSAKLAGMTADELAEATAREYVLDHSCAGKIMTSHEWYCAMVVDEEDGERFTVGRKVEVSFDSQGLANIEMQVHSVTKEEETGRAVVILSSQTVEAGILSARSVTVKVHFNTYTGLRVSDSAVRLVEGQVGVYISTGYDLRFRPIEVLYQGDGYQICRENLSDENGLKMFDKVIVKGTDLYDGKSLL